MIQGRTLKDDHNPDFRGYQTDRMEACTCVGIILPPQIKSLLRKIQL